MGAILNLGIKFAILFPAVVFGWTLLIGGPVTEMPFGLEEPVQLMASSIAFIIHIMPWMEIVLDIMIYGLQFKLMIILIEVMRWLLSMLVQN